MYIYVVSMDIHIYIHVKSDVCFGSRDTGYRTNSSSPSRGGHLSLSTAKGSMNAAGVQCAPFGHRDGSSPCLPPHTDISRHLVHLTVYAVRATPQASRPHRCSWLQNTAKQWHLATRRVVDKALILSAEYLDLVSPACCPCPDQCGHA